MQSRFDRSTIRKGLNIFFGLSIASILVIFYFAGASETWSALKRVEPHYLAVAVLFAGGDLLVGGLRMYILTRGLSTRVSFRAALKSSLANISMGALTPSQAGGGPAQVYMLYKNGLPFLESVSASLMTFVVTMIFFVVSAGSITLFGVNTSLEDNTLRYLFRYGVGLFMLFGIVFIVFTTWPSLLRAVIRGIFNFLSLFRKRHLLRPGGRANRVLDAAEEFHAINLDYLKRRPHILVLSVLVAAVAFGLKCFIAYFIVRGLGIQAPVWDVVSIQILILLAIYFFPTPGGTGAAELGAAVLMASILPKQLLPVYVVLWRLIVMYIAVAVGAVIMLRTLGSDTVVATRSGYDGVEKKIAVSGE